MEFHKVCSLLSDSAAYCMRQFLDHLFFLSNWAVGGSWCGLHGIFGIFSEPEGLPFKAKHLWILSQKKKSGLMKGSYLQKNLVNQIQTL